MTVYYGICLIIVVTSLCVAVLARLVTRGYLGEIESILDKRRIKKAQTVVQVVKDTVPYLERFVTAAKEAKKMDDENGKNGKKYSEAGFNSAMNDILKDTGIK